MKINESWLREFVDPALDAAEMGQRLTMAGLELDSLEPAAPEFSGVVVARIASIEQHPDADKLRICQLDQGDDEPLQVICGAANAAKGLIVALATVGAKLPGDFKIRKAKLRGIASAGMLCSASELGLETVSDGIMALPGDAPIGTDLRDYLQLNDQILEIDLTPNRADCLSVYGVARDLAVLTGDQLNPLKVAEVEATIEDSFPVRIEAPEACPNYVGRVIRGIRTDAVTPLWMQERLRRCGVRCLHPVVDITNFVMLEFGQPMHGFDLAKLNGGIVVRHAVVDETLVLLDGKEIKMDAATLVIADHASALALAGVMGGEGSAVDSATTDVFLESAYFTPEKMAGKARAFGLHTDASHRFERGVDFQLQTIAMHRASEWVLDICGGDAGPVLTVSDPEYLPVLPTIPLRRERVEQILGITMADSRVDGILTGLGCGVHATQVGWEVVPPSYRFDLRIEVDLIEELARIYGYDNIPSNSRNWSPRIEVLPEAKTPASRIKEYLTGLGYQEVITYSFIDAATESVINPDIKAKPLANPISSDLGVMRTTLWGGLLKTIQHNQRRQQKRVRVFESGLVFHQRDGELGQVARLSGAITGKLAPEQWNQPERDVDFYDVKGDLESLLQAMAIPGTMTWQPSNHPALHPGQSAEVLLNGMSVGQVGALHPQVQKTLDLDQQTFLFELEWDVLLVTRVPQYQPLSKFPSVRRDLAIVVDESVRYARILEVINSSGLELIHECQIFDQYNGEAVASGRKSLALGLILQDLSRTLSEEEVEQTIALVLQKLEAETGASLRE